MPSSTRSLRKLIARISQTISDINGYAKQISQLNDSIETAEYFWWRYSNDLLDQRDYAVTQLSKLVNVSVVEQAVVQ